MPILPQFNQFLQFSLIHNPGLLSREYGLPLLDIENISDTNDELNLELRWNQFLNVDHQAQKLFESSGFRLGILAESIFENWLREHKIDFLEEVYRFLNLNRQERHWENWTFFIITINAGLTLNLPQKSIVFVHNTMIISALINEIFSPETR